MFLIISGNFIMMSLFTALLLRNFEEDIARDIDQAAITRYENIGFKARVKRFFSRETCTDLRNFIVLTFGRKEDIYF